MGLFSFLSRKETLPQVRIRDMIWMNAGGKKQGCLKLLQQNPNTALVAWFPETQQLWQQFFDLHNLPNQVLLASHLNTLQIANKTIIMLEHYPLAAKEDAFLQMIRQPEVIILSALDEPLFAKFGGESTIALMQKMGMKEDEAIEHKMVSESLRNAQAELEKKVTVHQNAQSMQDWFAKNIS